MSKPPTRSRSESTRSSRVKTRGAGQVPQDLKIELATTGEGRDITRPYVGELEEYRDERLRGALDWGAYDRILLDDQVMACLAQRRTAVVSREWTVIAGDEDDPRAQEAAEALEADLDRIGWDLVTDKMLYAPFFGVAVAELVWGVHDGRIAWDAIRVRHARRFRYAKDGGLRLLTVAKPLGEPLPDRKFWVVTAGAADDDQPYGRGLAEWLYWPTLFKRNGIRFWNQFLDKYSLPPALGTYRPGTPKADIDNLLSAMEALANDAGVALPEGVKIELLQIASAGIDFEKMPAMMNEAIARIVLGQTSTSIASATGLGSGMSATQAGVKQELITADADLLTESFTRGPARWWTDLNYGPDVAAPKVIRHVEAEEDLKSTAETDAVLARMGWRRTEESFADIYGDGYERPATENPARPERSRGALNGHDDEGEDDKIVPFGRRKVASFAEFLPARDLVDLAVDQAMADEGWREMVDPMFEPLLAELAAAPDAAAVEAILTRAAARDDEGELVTRLARAAFAARLAGTAGIEG